MLNHPKQYGQLPRPYDHCTPRSGYHHHHQRRRQRRRHRFRRLSNLPPSTLLSTRVLVLPPPWIAWRREPGKTNSRVSRPEWSWETVSVCVCVYITLINLFKLCVFRFPLRGDGGGDRVTIIHAFAVCLFIFYFVYFFSTVFPRGVIRRRRRRRRRQKSRYYENNDIIIVIFIIVNWMGFSFHRRLLIYPLIRTINTVILNIHLPRLLSRTVVISVWQKPKIRFRFFLRSMFTPISLSRLCFLLGYASNKLNY